MPVHQLVHVLANGGTVESPDENVLRLTVDALRALGRDVKDIPGASRQGVAGSKL